MTALHTILDIHTHHAPLLPHAVVATSPEDFNPIDGQLYSVGIHPWRTSDDVCEETWRALEEAAKHPRVVAIGECGIDLTKGGPLFKQMQVFRRQIEISEKTGKPLVIHNVRAHDIIIGLHADLKPSQNWLIHGFRAKPSVARMFTQRGIWLSFGPLFNADTVREMPYELLLTETDDSDSTIRDVITAVSSIRGTDMTQHIISASSSFLRPSLHSTAFGETIL